MQSNELMLSKKAIEEFKQIYKKEFGKDISDAEAEEKGEKLLNAFAIIYRPIPKEWIKKYAKDK
jgi:hypothetical protein